MRLALLACLGLGLVACAPAASEDGASTDSAIIGGTRDTGDKAVVALIMSVGDDVASCTATFISKTVLLTAAHCAVDDDHPHTIPSKAKFQLMTAVSDENAADSDFIDVDKKNIHVHPAYDGDALHDVAIVVLDRPYDVTPVAIQRTPLQRSVVGSTVRLVGYGKTTRKNSRADEFDTRHTVTTTLRGFEDELLLIGDSGKQACDGDSGGPALLDVDGVPTLIATDDLAASDAANQDCLHGDYYQRVDVHMDFIAPFLEGAAGTDAPSTADDGAHSG